MSAYRLRNKANAMRGAVLACASIAMEALRKMSVRIQAAVSAAKSASWIRLLAALEFIPSRAKKLTSESNWF